MKAQRIAANDRQVLRRLAGRVAELAARPVEQEKRDLWYRHNALQPTRPLAFCDPENAWHEIIPADSLACTGELARAWEFRLRRELYLLHVGLRRKPGDGGGVARHVRRIRASLPAPHPRPFRVEIIMKDTHTIRHDPTRVIRWAQIARRSRDATRSAQLQHLTFSAKRL